MIPPMSTQERFGLLMNVVVGAALAAALFATGGYGQHAEAIPGCELPSLAESPTRPGATSGRSFDARDGDVVAQAEAFVCHEIRSARDTKGWALRGSDAWVYLRDGTANWDVQLRYTLGTYATPSSRYAIIIMTPVGQPLSRAAAAERGERVSLRGQAAEMWRTDRDGLIVRWTEDGLRFYAEVIAERSSPTQVNERDWLAFLSTLE